MSAPHDASRRRFLGYAALIALAPAAANQALAQAKPPAKPATKGLPRLPLDNPQAKALSYVEKTAGLKHAAFKAGSNCANCIFYKGAAGQAAGPCQLFPQHSVAAVGWCSGWAKKA
jgi:hypothetical protein